MIKYISIAIMAVTLSGCGDSFNSYQCMQSVKMEFPDGNVQPLPNNKYRFIVQQPNGDIVIAETMDTSSTKVTKSYTIFKGK